MYAKRSSCSWVLALTLLFVTGQAGQAQHLTYRSGEAYDANNAFSHTSLDVSGQTSNPVGSFLSPDGTKLFVVENRSTDYVYQYNLSIPFDLNTATYNSVRYRLATTISQPEGITFSADGTKMLIVNLNADRIHQHTLSMGFELDTSIPGVTITHNGSQSVGSYDSAPNGVSFNNDGSKLFLIGSGGSRLVNEFALGTNYEIITGSFSHSHSYSVSGQESSPEGVAFNASGDRMFVVGNNVQIHEYSLSTTFSLDPTTTISHILERKVRDLGVFFEDIHFTSNGDVLYFADTGNDQVVFIDLNNEFPFRESIVNDGSLESGGSIVIEISGETFTNGGISVGGTGSGMDVEITGIPSGLTPSIALSDFDTKATLTFSGTATSHNNADDVSDLQFVFNNSAFTGNNASAVAFSGSSGAHSSNMGIDFLANESKALIYSAPIGLELDAFVHSSTVVQTQESVAEDLTFSSDGMKMFIVGSGHDEVNEFDLTTAWNISTAGHVTNLSLNFPIGGQINAITFNLTGDRMYIGDGESGSIIEYSLSTAWDISTASAVRALSTLPQSIYPEAIQFSPAGDKMLISHNAGISEYDLTTAWDISTASFVQTFDTSTQTTTPFGLYVHPSGYTLYISGVSEGTVYEYELSTAFDVSTASYTEKSIDVDSEEANPYGLYFNLAGKMYTIGQNTDEVNEYDLDSPQGFFETGSNNGAVSGTAHIRLAGGGIFDDTGADNDLDNGSQVTIDNLPAGFSTPTYPLSAAATQFTFSLAGNATAHLDASDLSDLQFTFSDAAFAADIASNISNSTAYASGIGINFLDNLYRLLYQAPGAFDLTTLDYTGRVSPALQTTSSFGFTFSDDGTKLFEVENSGRVVYEHDLSVAFDIATLSYSGNSFSVAGQTFDPRDLEFNHDGTKMYVMNSDNSANRIYEYDMAAAYDLSVAPAYNGNFLDIDSEGDFPGDFKFSPAGDKVFVVINTPDQVSEYTLSSPFDIASGTNTYDLSVSADISSPLGLEFSHDGKKMFIHDGSEDIYQYDLTTGFDLSTSPTSTMISYDISAAGTSTRSFEFSKTGDRLIVLEDDELKEFSITSDFTEGVANDGAVDGTLSVLLYSDGGLTFNDDGGGNDLTGSQLTLGNVPAGLSSSFTLASDTVLNISFSGNATDHEEVNDVTDLTFLFDDSAFTGAVASDIDQATGPYSSLIGIDFLGSTAGGILSDVVFWVKANAGTSTTTHGATVSSWLDHSPGNDNDPSLNAGAPTYRLNAGNHTNFNPYIEFDGDDGFSLPFPNTLPTGNTARTYYFVSQSDDVSNNAGTILAHGEHINRALMAFDHNTGGNAIAVDYETGVYGHAGNTSSELTMSALWISRPGSQLSTSGIELSINGERESDSGDVTTSIVTGTTSGFLGQDIDETDFYVGQINEIIAFDTDLDGQERQRVESYLALKYGITLSSSNDGNGSSFEAPNGASVHEGDYVASDGITVFWDASANSTYHNNVAGIARDDETNLEQKISRSSNADAIVTIGLDDTVTPDGLEDTNTDNDGTFSADLSALVWGHDGEALYDIDENIDFDVSQVRSRLNREWRVQETGTIGTVTVQFDLSNIIGPDNMVGSNDESQVVLLVDNDSDFSSGASMVSQSFVVGGDDLVNFQVDFSDGQYFTLGSTEQYALPITLLSFGAKAYSDHVLLDWSTISEVNNSLFSIERSTDGHNFEPIGYLDGAGNSETLREYTFKDEQPADGHNYYRLIDIDHSGNENSSEVVRAYFEAPEPDLVLYPNPIQQDNLLRFKSNDHSPHDIKIVVENSYGQRILEHLALAKTYQDLLINTQTWTPGIYLLRVYEDGHLNKGPMKIMKRN